MFFIDNLDLWKSGIPEKSGKMASLNTSMEWLFSAYLPRLEASRPFRDQLLWLFDTQ